MSDGQRPPPAAAVTTALVLAAGEGSRLRSVVADRPKPLVRVAGRTVLEHNLHSLAAIGVQDVWINLHTQADQIRAHVGSGARVGLRVQYSFEPSLLGTAGAAGRLRRELGQATFLVVYGDNLCGLDLLELIAYHRQRAALATIAVFDPEQVPNTGLAGGRLVLQPDGRVARFEEGAASGGRFVNAGIYVLEPPVLAAIPDDRPSDFGRDVFPALLAAEAPVYGYPLDGYCLGIDTPPALERAERLLADPALRARFEVPA